MTILPCIGNILLTTNMKYIYETTKLIFISIMIASFIVNGSANKIKLK